MTRILTLMLLFFIPINSLFSQEERKIVRNGVKEYKDGKFTEAEVNFRKATDVKPGLFEAEYNIANSLYKQKKYEEAATEYDRLLQQNKDSDTRADLYHNLGNSQIMAQQFEKGIESYKNALRLRPDDEETRYNLSYALEKLKQQQQQQQQNQDQNKENKENKDQEKENKDKQDQKDQENKDQQQKDQENKDQQPKDEKQKKEEGSAAEPKISKEEAEQMLNAVQNQEKDVKEKMDKKKAVARPISSEKDW